MSRPEELAAESVTGQVTGQSEGTVGQVVDLPDDFIEIKDESIDVAAIMAEIRANLSQRPRLEPNPDAFVYRPGGSAFLSPADELEYYLDQLKGLYDKIYVGDQLRPGLTAKDKALNRIRQPLHQLVRFYCDILARNQVTVNSSILSSLNALNGQLLAQVEAQGKQIAELRQELDELKAQPPATKSSSTPAG